MRNQTSRQKMAVGHIKSKNPSLQWSESINASGFVTLTRSVTDSETGKRQYRVLVSIHPDGHWTGFRLSNRREAEPDPIPFLTRQVWE